eukprot:gene25785-1733_t
MRAADCMFVVDFCNKHHSSTKFTDITFKAATTIIATKPTLDLLRGSGTHAERYYEAQMGVELESKLQNLDFDDLQVFIFSSTLLLLSSLPMYQHGYVRRDTWEDMQKMRWGLHFVINDDFNKIPPYARVPDVLRVCASTGTSR